MVDQSESIFNKWRKNQNKENFQEIYKEMKPTIETASMKASYGSNIPQSAHKLYAAQAFYNALQTFTPGKGASLKTHVFGSVQNKAKRLNYMYQDLGHKPEPRAMKVGLYQSEFENMRLSLGRDPSVPELADRLNWNQRDVQFIQKEVVKDLALAEGVEEHAVHEGSKDQELLQYLYYELTGDEKNIYDYVFGKHGKPKLSTKSNRPNYDKISLKVGFSVSKVRSIWKTVGDKYKKVLEK